MTATAEVVTDERETKIKLVLLALGRDDELSRAELALLDELENEPGVSSARGAYSARLEEAARLAEAARLEALRAEQDQREAERVARVEARRKLWREADPLVRALHVLAERLGVHDRLAKHLLELADMVADPRKTLLTRMRYVRGEPVPRVERAPPETFEPGLPGDDPVNEETK